MSTTSTTQTRKMDVVDQFVASTGKKPIRYYVFGMRDNNSAASGVVESFDSRSAIFFLHSFTLANGERPFDRYITVEFPDHLTNDEVDELYNSDDWECLAAVMFLTRDDKLMSFGFDEWTRTIDILNSGDFVELDSSCLRSVAYLGANKILSVEFRSGTRYEYHGVPRNVFDELISAESAGRYFVRNIRNNKDYITYNVTSKASKVVA